MRLRQERWHCAQMGTGLIEVLVALLLISMAAIGLGNIQISAGHIALEAEQRREAVVLISDLFERMRGNRQALPHYHFHEKTGERTIETSLFTRDCSAQPCDPEQMAHWDLQQWSRSLNGGVTADAEAGLNRPIACVTVIDREVVVEIAWQGLGEWDRTPDGATCDADAPIDVSKSRHYLRLASWVGAK
ncbi:MAG: type IV pilus modification protein PilV [Pseudomonadota bacterium]